MRHLKLWARRCLDWNRRLHSPVDFVRRYFREQRRRRRDAEWENEPDDGYGDEGAAEMMEAAGREIRARSRREAEIHGLILTALPPAPVPSVGRNQPCPCGSGRKSKKCCGRQGENVKMRHPTPNHVPCVPNPG